MPPVNPSFPMTMAKILKDLFLRHTPHSDTQPIIRQKICKGKQYGLCSDVAFECNKIEARVEWVSGIDPRFTGILV